MEKSRRRFLGTGAAVVGAGLLGTSAARAQEAKPMARRMVGACGLACKTCPLMKAGKCKGCASGKEASPALLKMKPCPVLLCAAKKNIDYCGTGCKMFTMCKKVIGRPYAPSFMAKIRKRMGMTKA